MDRYLTPPEVAVMLGVSTGQLRTWRSQGRGPAFVKYGPQTVRYAVSAVEAWLEARRTEGAPSNV